MAKLNTESHKASYNTQGAGDFAAPPSGIYEVVNVQLQRQLVGAASTEKLQVRAHILKCIEGGGAAFVGKKVSLDFWMNMEKEFNATKLSHLVMAVTGANPSIDTEVDADLVGALTGQPYVLKISTEAKEYQGKKRDEVRVLETKFLGKAAREAYTKLPDWSKIVPANKAERMLELKDWSQGNGRQSDAAESSTGSKGGGGSKSQDPFGDDIPF